MRGKRTVSQKRGSRYTVQAPRSYTSTPPPPSNNLSSKTAKRSDSAPPSWDTTTGGHQSQVTKVSCSSRTRWKRLWQDSCLQRLGVDSLRRWAVFLGSMLAMDQLESSVSVLALTIRAKISQPPWGKYRLLMIWYLEKLRNGRFFAPPLSLWKGRRGGRQEFLALSRGSGLRLEDDCGPAWWPFMNDFIAGHSLVLVE